eukprot:15435054-Alexandrium_andersonii.AAC.1
MTKTEPTEPSTSLNSLDDLRRHSGSMPEDLLSLHLSDGSREAPGAARIPLALSGALHSPPQLSGALRSSLWGSPEPSGALSGALQSDPVLHGGALQ